MEHGFPELTDSFLAGQDILYAQFNDVDFYVEDTNQEHFYFNILKKLFPDIKFEKIFPLNGKDKVIDAARLTIGDKKKIYIVDLDFDSILNVKEVIANLFYLEKYSIENYLFTKKAIYEAIRSKTPSLKDIQIDTQFDYEDLLDKCQKSLVQVACSCVLIKKYSLGLSYYTINSARDIDFSLPPPFHKNTFISNFFSDVELALKRVNKRFTLRAQLKKIMVHFRSLKAALSLIPGKFVLVLIKERLEYLKLIAQTKLDSFMYNLAKDIEYDELAFLKISILNYMGVRKAVN
ncbi:MAG: DUF4435 domain-containing protein [Niastella sp.]|nr:DUF4435 domain-containing protein [Niastella sp.]